MQPPPGWEAVGASLSAAQGVLSGPSLSTGTGLSGQAAGGVGACLACRCRPAPSHPVNRKSVTVRRGARAAAGCGGRLGYGAAAGAAERSAGPQQASRARLTGVGGGLGGRVCSGHGTLPCLRPRAPAARHQLQPGERSGRAWGRPRQCVRARVSGAARGARLFGRRAASAATAAGAAAAGGGGVAAAAGKGRRGCRPVPAGRGRPAWRRRHAQKCRQAGP